MKPSRGLARNGGNPQSLPAGTLLWTLPRRSEAKSWSGGPRACRSHATPKPGRSKGRVAASPVRACVWGGRTTAFFGCVEEEGQRERERERDRLRERERGSKEPGVLTDPYAEEREREREC